MKNLITITVLFLLTIGSYLFLKSITKKTVQSDDGKEKIIVATAYGVSTRYFNKENQLQYKLLSPEAIEYSHNYGTELIKPSLSVFDEKMVKIWQGNADKGVLSGNKDNLLLQKNVKITEMPQGKKPTYITGEEMNYQAKKRLLSSDLPVKIDDGIVVQLSDKLTLNTKTKKLNANDKVRATYKTNNRIIKD